MKILLACDSNMIRTRIETTINEVSDAEVIGMVTDTNGTIDEVERARPDVVVISFLKLSQSPLRLASILRDKNPDIVLIALASATSPYSEDAWRRAGCDYVFSKTVKVDSLTSCLHTLVDRKRNTNDLTHDGIRPPSGDNPSIRTI